MITNELPVLRTNKDSDQSFILVDQGQRSPKEKLTSSPRVPFSSARIVTDAGVFTSEIARVLPTRTTHPSVIAPGVAAVGRGASSRAVALKLGNTHSHRRGVPNGYEESCC